MSAVVAGVKAKLALKLPGQIGTNRQWSDTYVETLILAAAHAASERIGYQWVEQTITPAANTFEYALNSTFVEVSSVDYSADGTSYTRHLSPISLQKLDRLNVNWRDDRAIEPTRYALISTPGLQSDTTAIAANNTAKILIHPAPTGTGAARIRIGGFGIGSSTQSVPDGLMERVHVPYVMSILRSTQNPQEAMVYYRQFVDGCDEVRGRFADQYVTGTVNGESC